MSKKLNINDLNPDQISNVKRQTLKAIAVNVFDLNGKYIKTCSVKEIAKELNAQETYIVIKAIKTQKLLNDGLHATTIKSKYFITGEKGVDYND